MIKKLAVFHFLILLGIISFAQKANQEKTLKEVLRQFEEQYNISFTYADEHINNVKLIPPSRLLTVHEALKYLEEKSGLQFKMLDDRFVTIINNEENVVNICGYVHEKESGATIKGATLQAGNISAVSGDAGYFEIAELEKSDTILIRYLGCQSTRIPVKNFDSDICQKVFLIQKITKLQEVIITNFITSGINVSSDGAVKINAEALGILPGLTDPDVLQTIQALPGIQSINETVSDINVRGGTNDQNLIFWDGIKMYQSGHFFGLISAFNPYLTKEVVLIKNGTTTALSDGVSSTIDIITENSINQEFSGGAGINMINADMYLKFPLGPKASLHLSGRRSISDILQTPTYNQFFKRIFRNTDVINSEDNTSDTLLNSNDNFNFYDISVKLLYDLSPRDRLRISFLSVNNSISYEENARSINEFESKTSGLDQGSIATGLQYHRTWSDQFAMAGKFYLSSYKLNATNHDLLNDQRLIQENNVLDMGLKLEARIALNNNLDLLTGYQFYETGVTNLEDINNPVFRRLIKKVLRYHAFFAEGNFTSNAQKSNIRLGLRGNYYEKFNKYILEPRLAFNQRFWKNFSFEVLGEMKNQSTTQVIDLQNDFLGVEKRRWILANEDDIPIVTSQQISAGIRYQNERFIFSVNGYLKNVRGITSSSQGFQNQFQYNRSSGSYDVSGIDVLLNKQFSSFTTWISYSYAENNYDFPEFLPSIFPNNLDIRHTATLGTSYQYKGFQTSLGLNWRTGKPFTVPIMVDENEIIYDLPNSSNLEDYIRVDFSSKYSFNMSSNVTGEVGISVWNLFGSKNIVNTYYEVSDNGQLETIQQYALGLTPNVMFRIYF